MSEPSPQTPAHPWATVAHGKRGVYAWFDRAADIGDAWGRHLPHWRQPGTVYFVTFRTEDSIPSRVLADWKREREAWLVRHPAPRDEITRREYHQLFTARMHRFLDDCQGECPFREPSLRRVIEAVLNKQDGEADGYALDEYVIMPNHVHVLVAPCDGTELSAIGKVWKRVSAHRVNPILGRKGPLWQHESWDHIVRSPEHLEHYRRYIRENPNHLPR